MNIIDKLKTIFAFEPKWDWWDDIATTDMETSFGHGVVTLSASGIGALVGHFLGAAWVPLIGQYPGAFVGAFVGGLIVVVFYSIRETIAWIQSRKMPRFEQLEERRDNLRDALIPLVMWSLAGIASLWWWIGMILAHIFVILWAIIQVYFKRKLRKEIRIYE